MNQARVATRLFCVAVTIASLGLGTATAQDREPTPTEAAPPTPAPPTPAPEAAAPQARDAEPVSAPRESAPATPSLPPAILTRLTDPVAFLDGESKSEKVLFHWEKKHELRFGDGFRQGVAGVSELYFPADHCQIRAHGDTHAFLVDSGADEHRLRVYTARRVRVEARETPVVLELEGGVTITLAQTIMALALDERDHRWWLKNEGRGEIRVEAPRLPLGAASVPSGNELTLPLLRDEETATLGAPAAAAREVWDGHTIETVGEVTTTRRSNEIEFSGSGTARVGGARIVIEGSSVRVWKPRG
jgi:hypothetical protein